jgi:bifunctional non-homologous end joining protein LigD
MRLWWEELDEVAGGAAFGLQAALERAGSLKADPWEGMAKLQQRLPKA